MTIRHHHHQKNKILDPQIGFKYEVKKKTAGTTLFLSRIARSRTSKLVDLAEHEKEAKIFETHIVNFRTPTKDDFKFVPTNYEPGRPLLSWDKLKKISAGIKRMHDWYMRAASVGIDTINVIMPPKAFNSERTKAIVTFEDMWLMMNLQRLDM
jgi:hypothetical protein